MKVTAFVGSARRQHTYRAVERLLADLRSRGGVETEVVFLSDHRLEICRGCKLCCDRGEELCPLQDDRDALLEKLFSSDGVVFAAPNYSFNVSGQMKVFLDRLGFALHRPRGFGKAFTSITVEAIYRGREIAKYFDFIGMGLRYNVVKGCVVKSLEPMTKKVQARNERTIDRLSREFYATLIRKEMPSPSLFELFMFRWGRTSIQGMLDETWRDYRYYRESGWFASDYFYPTRLGLVKRTFARAVDAWFARRMRKDKAANAAAGGA